MKAIRHGDMALTPIKKLPEGLTKAKNNVLMTGSQGNDHTCKNCDVYFEKVDEFVFGYLVAKKDARLYHVEHGKRKVGGLMEVDLPEGVYELRKQFEHTNQGMVAVID